MEHAKEKINPVDMREFLDIPALRILGQKEETVSDIMRCRICESVFCKCDLLGSLAK